MTYNTVFYNFYNIKNQYTPEKPLMPSWKEEREVTVDKIKHKNNDPDSEKYKSYERLEARYYAVSVSNRAKYKTEGEVIEALCNKYLGNNSKYKDIYSEEEREAMFANERDMTLFGCLSSGGHPLDPFAGENPVNDTKNQEEQKKYNRKMVTTQINNIFQSNQLADKLGSDLLTFSIDPLTKRLSVSGTQDKSLMQKIEEVLNKENNSSELFYYIMQNSSSEISTSERNKYLITSMFYDVTGEDFNQYIKKDGSYYSNEGKNAIDVFRESLFQSDSLHKGEEYTHFQELLDKVSYTDLAMVPNLILNIGFQNGVLMDMPFGTFKGGFDTTA